VSGSGVKAFYDTVIFVLSLNTADPDHALCRDLLDTNTITWSIAVSAITRGEASIHEYLDQLEQRCALQGIEWFEISSKDIAATAKQYRSLKTSLQQAGMQSDDIKQIFAAIAATASLFVTRDRDFLDPKDKAKRGKKTRGTAIDRLLDAKRIALEVMFPAAALDRLTAS
jgi:predicted nucleic acid-binding protein